VQQARARLRIATFHNGSDDRIPTCSFANDSTNSYCFRHRSGAAFSVSYSSPLPKTEKIGSHHVRRACLYYNYELGNLCRNRNCFRGISPSAEARRLRDGLSEVGSCTAHRPSVRWPRCLRPTLPSALYTLAHARWLDYSGYYGRAIDACFLAARSQAEVQGEGFD